MYIKNVAGSNTRSLRKWHLRIRKISKRPLKIYYEAIKAMAYIDINKFYELT